MLHMLRLALATGLPVYCSIERKARGDSGDSIRHRILSDIQLQVFTTNGMGKPRLILYVLHTQEPPSAPSAPHGVACA